jgi:hypothetical protein
VLFVNSTERWAISLKSKLQQKKSQKGNWELRLVTSPPSTSLQYASMLQQKKSQKGNWERLAASQSLDGCPELQQKKFQKGNWEYTHRGEPLVKREFQSSYNKRNPKKGIESPAEGQLVVSPLQS